ncbi:MAG: serpin family protein [Clostridia bacterium]|nr:serpin family protein [Clostridia bacterium]
MIPGISRCLIPCCISLAVLTGCGPFSAGFPSAELTPQPHESRAAEPTEIGTEFCSAQIRFAAELFRTIAEVSVSDNILLSPLSVSLALSLCANGAEGETKEEMERVLGMSVSELNNASAAYTASFPDADDCSLYPANSVWFRDDQNLLTVHDSFLCTASDYYAADVFASPIDLSAVRDINRWGEKKTNGMIPSIVKEIPESAVLYLINALAFDAKWDKPYNSSDLFDSTFSSYDGEEQEVRMMRSTESLYIEGRDAVGFIRPYQGKRFSFAAILPEEGTDIYSWISSLTAEKLSSLLENVQNAELIACIPPFSTDDSFELANALAALGMPSAFDTAKADFSSMAETADGSLFIGQVLHRTHIAVDTDGTRAAALTAVMMETGGAACEEKPTVILNRPFVYMILDTENKVPLFIGAAVSLD